MTSHVGADTHLSLGRRCEMEVGIETGYRVDLAKRHLNLCGELPQSIGRQIAELVLNGPKFVDQAPRSPCFRMMTSLSGILSSKFTFGNGELGPGSVSPAAVHRFQDVPSSPLISCQRVGISKTITPKCARSTTDERHCEWRR